MKKDEVVRYLQDEGLEIVRITPLQKAKHIFSHKEWHMIGYQVRVDELAKMMKEGERKADWLFVSPAKTQEEYPIPSALSAYAQHLNIKQGKQKWE